MCENVTSEVTATLVKSHKNKSIDLLVCNVYSKKCLEAPDFGDCCTTTTPCWNDTHANIFHQPPCEMNLVGPVCCPHAVSPLSVMFYLLPPICWEITQPICKADACLGKHMVLQVTSDPGSSLQFLCSDPKRIVCHWVLQIPSLNWVTAI